MKSFVAVFLFKLKFLSQISFSTMKNPDWTPFGSKSNPSFKLTPLNCFVIVRTPSTILIVFVSSIFMIVAGHSKEWAFVYSEGLTFLA